MNSIRISEIFLSEKKALQQLFPMLMERVFHVTKAIFYESIIRTSAILPNQNGTLETSFGSSKKSFFRNQGCVSVFDYRAIPPEKFDQFVGKCAPTMAASPDSPMVVLYLSEIAVHRLIPWTAWKIEGHREEMILPYLEAGHRGPIPISDIDEVLKVTIQEDPNSITSILRRARQNAC